jgi:undecaprenyl diphosphate synthase
MNNLEIVPKHVAIIPDGNRRWAKDRGLKPWDGHDEGAQKIEQITRKARELNIKYLSFWGSSIENLQKRSIKERQALLKIYEVYFEKLMSSEDIFEQKVKINVLGNWKKQLPNKLVHIINNGIEKTKYHDNFFLNFFLAYSGDIEMVEAVQNIVDTANKNTKVTPNLIKENLLTKDLPPVDYLIRTGGEPHLSAGFMMWDIANAQLFFSDEYFPDFDSERFEISIKEYGNRVRRMGA